MSYSREPRLVKKLVEDVWFFFKLEWGGALCETIYKNLYSLSIVCFSYTHIYIYLLMFIQIFLASFNGGGLVFLTPTILSLNICGNKFQ
jgi:hypothetical protein